MSAAVYNAMYDSDFAEIYAKMLDEPENLSVQEMLQINSRLRVITEWFFRECYLVQRGVFVECDNFIRSHIPIYFGNQYAQAWWTNETMMKAVLPSWVDEEISQLDPDTEMQRFKSIRNQL